MPSTRTPFYDASHADRMKDLTGTRLASFGSRATALTVDFVLGGVLFLPLAAGTLIAIRNIPAIARMAGEHVDVHLSFFHNWYSVAYFAAYFGLALYWGKGRTPGKRLMKIRVVSVRHEHLSLWHCLERALGYGASTLELGFGFFQYFIHPNRQTVHDRIAETIVIDERVSSAAQPPVESREEEFGPAPPA